MIRNRQLCSEPHTANKLFHKQNLCFSCFWGWRLMNFKVNMFRALRCLVWVSGLLFAFGSTCWYRKVNSIKDCCFRLDKCCGVKASAVAHWWFYSIGAEVQSLPGYSKCYTKFTCVASTAPGLGMAWVKIVTEEHPQAHGRVSGWFRRAELTWARQEPNSQPVLC